MLKKKVIPITKNSIGLKCGDCLHYKLNAKFESPCAELGIKRFSDAPSCYSPNVYLLGRKNPDTVFALGMLLREFTAQDMRVFMSLLKQSKAFEKHYGLKFGQPVYFCIGEDYISNYYAGFVVGVAECGDSQVFVSSDLSGKQRKSPLVGSFLRDSVRSVSEFKKHRAKLLKDGRVLDPKPVFTTVEYTPSMETTAYVPPSMDSAPPEWFYKESAKKSRKSGRTSSKSLKKQLDGSLEFHVGRS